MASKNLSSGTQTAETVNGPVILHSGQGNTYCPFCHKPTPSRGLNCKKCGEKRDAHNSVDHYVRKSPKSSNNAEVTQLTETVSSLDKEVKSLKDQLANERTERLIEREGRLEEKGRRIISENALAKKEKETTETKRLRLENARLLKVNHKLQKQLAEKSSILGWLSKKASQHS